MSILRDFRKREIDTFPGLDSRTEPRKNIRAQKVENVHFELDHPRTRSGLGQYSTVAGVDDGGYGHGMGAPTSHFSFTHFLTTAWAKFVALASDGSAKYLYYETLSGEGATDVLKASLNALTTNAVSAVYGTRIYTAFTDDDGDAISTQQGIVWNGNVQSGVGPQVDTLFQPPLSLSVTVTPTEPSSGVVTEGNHKIGLVYTTRNGYDTKPTVYSTPVTASGDMNLLITLSPSLLPGGVWPLWVQDIKLIITTVQNTELYYFVPLTEGGVVSPTPGGSGAVSFTFNMEDIALTQAQEATDWFTLTTSTEIGEVKFIGTYGDRMVYISDKGKESAIWFSDVGDPQRIAADRNQRFLPNKRPANGGAELNGVYYVFGPNDTYAFTETTDFPVTWFPPQQMSSSVGIKYPGCVARNSTNSMLWVAHTSGLYTFNGQQYNDLPASYRQPVEWARINWAAPSWCFKLIDDEVNEQVLFQVPLDGAVKPSHVLKWDYKRGFSRDHVRFSIDNYKDGEGPLVPVLELVQNPNTSLLEVWALDAESNAVYRTKNRTDDASTWFTDDGLSIESVYRSEALSPVGPAPLKHGGTHARITGAGDVYVTIYPYVGSLDLADSYRFKGAYTRDLDATQYGPYLFLLGWQSETVYLEVSNNENDSWWELGSITHYYNDWLAQR